MGAPAARGVKKKRKNPVARNWKKEKALNAKKAGEVLERLLSDLPRGLAMDVVVTLAETLRDVSATLDAKTETSEGMTLRFAAAELDDLVDEADEQAPRARSPAWRRMVEEGPWVK